MCCVSHTGVRQLSLPSASEVLLVGSNAINEQMSKDFLQARGVIRRMLVKSIATAKGNVYENCCYRKKKGATMIPNYLKNHIRNVKEKHDSTVGELVSSTGNANLEVYFYGNLVNIKKTPYIVDADFPCLIVAKDAASDEMFTVFDGTKHGYDAMFCNDPLDRVQRELKRYGHAVGAIQITLGYSIDYEDEKEDYEFDEDGNVVLMYGSMDWEQAKSIGFDWISLKFTDTKKEFVDLELA